MLVLRINSSMTEAEEKENRNETDLDCSTGVKRKKWLKRKIKKNFRNKRYIKKFQIIKWKIILNLT